MKKLPLILLLGTTACNILYATSEQEEIIKQRKKVEVAQAKAEESRIKAIAEIEKNEKSKTNLLRKFQIWALEAHKFQESDTLTPEQLKQTKELADELAERLTNNYAQKNDLMVITTVEGLVSSICPLGVLPFLKQLINANGTTEQGIAEGLRNTQIIISDNSGNIDAEALNQCRDLHTFFQTLKANQ
jgi:hypothetical protein